MIELLVSRSSQPLIAFTIHVCIDIAQRKFKHTHTDFRLEFSPLRRRAATALAPGLSMFLFRLGCLLLYEDDDIISERLYANLALLNNCLLISNRSRAGQVYIVRLYSRRTRTLLIFHHLRIRHENLLRPTPSRLKRFHFYCLYTHILPYIRSIYIHTCIHVYVGTRERNFGKETRGFSI